MSIKVTIPKEMKSIITLADMPAVREIQKDFREGEDTLEELGNLAMFVFNDKVYDFFNASAEIAKNRRVSNFWNDNSKDLDVWIKFIAFNSDCGCYEVGAYVSDIYNIDPRYKKEMEIIKSHMYVNSFTTPDRNKA